jgi:hypothetical protein
MAQMIPSALPSGNGYNVEHKVYGWLKEGLSDDFLVFHSVDYLYEPGRGLREGEIDFLIFHPYKGLIVLEVKGGKEIYTDASGQWYSVSHRNETHSIHDPFEQGRSNLHNLFDRAKEQGIIPGERYLQFPRGYAVLFPDTEALPNLPIPVHADRAIILDYTFQHDPQAAIDRVLKCWRGKNDNRDRKRGKQQLRAIKKKVLLPEFRLVRSLKGQMVEAEEAFVRLTEEQNRLMSGLLQANKRALVEGYAGTGKTLLATHRARQLSEEGCETLFLCFNRNLADHLTTVLSDTPKVKVSTFHELANDWRHDAPDLTFPAYPDKDFWEHGAAELIMSAVEHASHHFDAVVVDEAQDFKVDWWVAVQSLQREDGYFYVFTDSGQDIYGGSLNDLLELPITVPLVQNRRSTNEIRAFAASLLDRDEKSPANAVSGSPVETSMFTDATDQQAQLESIIRKLRLDEGISTSDIVLLSPHNFNKSRLLRDADYQLAGHAIEQFSFDAPDNKTLYAESLHRFKGLEAPVVILFDVGVSERASTNENIYVGATRAQQVLYVLHTEDWTVPEAVVAA